MNVTVQDDQDESDGWKWTCTEGGHEVRFVTEFRLEPVWMMSELMDRAQYALLMAAK